MDVLDLQEDDYIVAAGYGEDPDSPVILAYDWNREISITRRDEKSAEYIENPATGEKINVVFIGTVDGPHEYMMKWGRYVQKLAEQFHFAMTNHDISKTGSRAHVIYGLRMDCPIHYPLA